MAASTAEPPACKILTPAWEASEWGEVTMPRYASVAGRLVSRMRLAPSRRERQLHPDVGARVAVVVVDLPEPVAAIEPHRGLEPALAVQAKRGSAERAGLLQHAGHQPIREAAAPARRAQPHALELGHARGEAAPPSGPAAHPGGGGPPPAAPTPPRAGSTTISIPPAAPPYSPCQSATSWSRPAAS